MTSPTRWVLRRAKQVPLTLATIEGFHRTIFEDVFPDFAGRLRGPAPTYLPTNVQFGNRYGTRYENVHAECGAMCGIIVDSLPKLDALRRHAARETFRREVLRVAAYTHSELLRIHHFADGNGRTARTCINYFCARYDILPLPDRAAEG